MTLSAKDIIQRYLSTGQAAEYSGLNRKTLYKMLEEGDLNGERTPGGHWRIDRESIDDFFDSSKKEVAIIRSLEL